MHYSKWQITLQNVISFFSVFLSQELNLSFGEITEEAALAVAHAIKDKSQLEKLDLNGTLFLLLHLTFQLLDLLFVKTKKTKKPTPGFVFVR